MRREQQLEEGEGEMVEGKAKMTLNRSMAASVVLALQCSVHCRTTEDPWHDTVRSQRPETRDPRILIISIFLHIKLELENTLWHLSDGKNTNRRD